MKDDREIASIIHGMLMVRILGLSPFEIHIQYDEFFTDGKDSCLYS